VRGHVDDVPGSGHQRQQPVGLLLGAFRGLGRLPQMDPVVERPRVAAVPRHHALERGDRLRGFLVGQAVARPVVPRPQVHQRFREQRRRVEVAREPAVHLAHRRGVGGIGGLTVCGLAGVACAQRLDVGPFARRRAGAARHRLLHQFERPGFVVGRHRAVDVRPEHQGLPPVGHRAGRVEAGGFRERPTGLGVIEPVGQVQPLVDELLGARRTGRDRKGVGAELLEARRQDAARPGLRRALERRVVLVPWALRRRVGGQDGQSDEQRQRSHKPPCPALTTPETGVRAFPRARQ
jgi:hypothetical protein